MDGLSELLGKIPSLASGSAKNQTQDTPPLGRDQTAEKRDRSLVTLCRGWCLGQKPRGGFLSFGTTYLRIATYYGAPSSTLTATATRVLEQRDRNGRHINEEKRDGSF